jgi:hypothetical protein
MGGLGRPFRSNPPAFQYPSNPPAFQDLNRLVQRSTLVGLIRAGAEIRVRRKRECERGRIMLGARQARGVIREIRTSEIIIGKPGRDRAPSLDSLAQLRLRERPQMPCGTIVVVERDGACCQLVHDLWAGAGEPVCVREADKGSDVGGLVGREALVSRDVVVSQRSNRMVCGCVHIL